MKGYILSEKEKIEQQKNILKVIEYQAREVAEYVPCKERVMKEEVLDCLIDYQIIAAERYL